MENNMSEQASKRSRELFDNGYYCAESVLLAIAESKSIQSDLIPKIATGFCSGVSRTSGVCGAVNGAIMGISLATGRSSRDETVERCYMLTRQFISQFQEQHGSTSCGQLTGCDLASEEGQIAFKKNRIIERCQHYVEDAASIASSLINKENP